MANVRLEGVSKRYKNDLVVNHLNLEIAAGEFLVIVGPSGCGKSTTLRMLAGLEDISEGAIYIGQRCINNVPSKDRDIAMVFQNYALYPHMTVFENLSFSLQLQRTASEEIKTRVHQTAEQLDIFPLLHRYPRELSGGQRQRVALGRAIIRRPSLFLLDEPLSNLDAQLRSQARSELAQLHRKLGTTFIYVTHDQEEAMTLGTRIAILRRGILQQVATPYQIYHEPCNTFVAQFIGNPAMNFLQAILHNTDNGLHIVAHGFSASLPTKQSATLYSKCMEERGSDRPITLGIRPENIYDHRTFSSHLPEAFSDQESLIPITGWVASVEMLGHERILTVELEDKQRLTARIRNEYPYPVGESVSLWLDMSKLHFFDPETGDRL